jgi:tripeptidyl-peptidase-1
MLNANYETFTHIETGKQITRTLSVSLPAELTAHIEALHPATGYFSFVLDFRMVNFGLVSVAL